MTEIKKVGLVDRVKTWWFVRRFFDGSQVAMWHGYLEQKAKVETLAAENAMLEKLLDETQDEASRMRRWVEDLQSGLFINCVYCGHRYGPADETPVAMSKVLESHVETCHQHPMYRRTEALKLSTERLSALLELDSLDHWLNNAQRLVLNRVVEISREALR